ncbi:MAG: cadherin domain-containing protein [Fibrobacter sp.]|nr:cadherin domain-containing protein [Fibrobacter sp.]
MWLGKLSLKAAAVVLVGAVSSMAVESSISPLTFGASSAQQEVNNWNYLTKFKLWGTTGIQFGWRPEFYDTRYYNKSGSGNYSGVNILDSLGWVGTATGNLSHESGKNGGWLDGPIIVGGAITAQQMTIITGPVRTGSGSVNGSFTSCQGSNNSGNCSYDKVPEIRSGLKVPTLSGVNWANYSPLNLNKTEGRRETTIDISNSGQPTCSNKGICDLFFSSINFENDNRLIIKMPEGGRITRIFTNSFTTKTHPQIVVSYGNGTLDASKYEGNLLVYVNSDVSLSNTDYADFTGTYVVNGTLTGKSNMTVTGQFIANKIIIGDDFKAQNFVFKPFVVWPELSILGKDAIYFEESNSWQNINVALSSVSTEEVSFNYCFEFEKDHPENGVNGVYAGYKDVGAADASHKFPICNKNESVKVTIPVGETDVKGINIKPLIDGVVENNEALWFQVNNLTGAQLASDYEAGLGYKIYIISNDKLPTGNANLIVNVDEDTKHVFTEAEFKFQHATQKFASVIITSIPAKGTISLNGTAITSGGKTIPVADFAKLTYQPGANDFGNNYTSFKFKVVGDGSADNTSAEYTATVNVIPVNDKPTVASATFTVNELDHAIAGGPIVITDVSNERNVDTYTYAVVTGTDCDVNMTSSDATTFNTLFEISKLSNQNATIKVKSGATFNYSVKKKYEVCATVKDNAATETQTVTGGGAKTSDQFKITVTVKNENDAPKIGDQTFTIAEKKADGSDWPSGTSVGKVTTASDPDDDPLTYSIVTTGVPFKFSNGSNELVITDGSVLDFETKPTWTLKVQVSDGDLTATATVTVKLTDVNEPIDPPVIKNEYAVKENTDEHTAVTSIGSFEVFDQDAGDVLTYSITGVLTGAVDATTAKKNLSDIFVLKETKNTNGTRTVSINVKDASLLDYEKLYNSSKGNATYQATITITDKASHKVTKTTNIAIQDVNEKVSAKGGTFVLNEHSPIGDPVCAVEYKDAEGNPTDCAKVARVEGSDLDIFNASFSTLTYEIIKSKQTGEDYKKFTVNKNTGVLYTNDEFDYESGKKKFTFVVTVSDGEFTADANVVVNLDDIKEPTISTEYEGDVTVKENTAEDETVVDFVEILEKIKDKDEDIKNELAKIDGKINFKLDQEKSVGAEGVFGITATLGKAIVKVKDPSKLDFEALYSNDKTKDKTTYKVVVVASGVQANGASVEVPITMGITVTDVNEKPEITSASSENNPPTGVTKGTFEIFVPETWTEADDFFGKVVATDPDNAYGTQHPLGFNKLTYKVEDVVAVDGSTEFPFELDPNTGKFTVAAGKVLDYTKQKQYKCVVKVMDRSLDKDNPSQSTTETIVINVMDVNRPSEFKVLSNLYEVEENKDPGTELDGKQIVVYDEDDADFDELVITITDKNATATRDAAKFFEVVQVGKTDKTTHLSTFVIKTKAGIDYEALYNKTDAEAAFDITLTIVDTEVRTKYPEQDTKIQVIDVNEEPAFTKTSYAFSVPENVTKETSLGVAEATDPDIYNPKYGTLYFSLEGDESTPFDINGSTGEISVSKSAKLDYETKKIYEFFAVVTDKKLTKKVPVTVNVTNEKEPPVFPSVPDLSVDENTLKGTKVGVVAADDDDCKNNNTCKNPTYTLVATDIDADDYKSFTIDPTSGSITVAKDSILNFEVQKEYSVRVVATDGDDPTLSSYIDVTIKVNDVNDAPTYDKKEYVFEIHENAPKGEFIGTVNADDEDSWSKLTFALSEYVSGSGDTAPFEIDDDGSIFLATKTLNYEKQKEYMIWATATDNGKDKGFENYKATTLVTIKIIDDPDKPIIKDDGKPGYDVAENTADNNTPTGFEIACYEVSDEDKGQVESLVAYVKDAGNTDADRLFGAKIKKDGSAYKLCLTVKNGDRLNYEVIEHTHNVIVAVMDADKLTAEVTKKLTITDVNEMPIISGNKTFSFYDRNKIGDVVGKLYPDDIDTSKAFIDNVFSVVGGDTDAFEITEDGKIKAKKVFDFQKDAKLTYTLDIALSDRDSKTYPKLTVKTTITITIKNRPKAPEITSTEFKVKENSDGGTPIGTIEAKDPDGDDDKLLYELTEENPYVTVTQSGEIKVKDGAEIDYEKMQEFTISVTVKDIDGMETDGDIVIKVIDVNEAPKIIPQEFNFPEDSKPGTKKGPIEAKDPDTKNPDFNDLKFYPVEENDKFEIKTNGDVVLKGDLDYETQKSYVIKVYVTDGEFNDTTDITLNVGNVIERSDVQITRVEAGDSVYLNPKKEDIIYTNKEVILVEWKQDGKTKSSLDTLKEGCQQIIKSYKDPSKDIAGADTIEVCYSTASPVVDVFAPKTKVEADNIFTVVEEVDKKDSSIYVNEKDKDVKVTVKDTVSGYTETFNVTVVLDTVAVPDKAVKTLIDVAKSQPSLDKNPKSGVSTTPVNDNKTVVSYKEKVDGHDVVVSYNVDSDGEIIKVPVIGEDGQKKMTEVIEVSTTVEVKGKTVVVSYKADAETGKMLYGDSEGNLMVDVPSSSSSKPSSSSSKKGDSSSSSKKGNSSSSSNKGSDSDEVDLKTGVGAFTVTYDAKGVEGNKATVSYVIDEKGKIVANDEGDRGYLVTYTYTNKYGNSADKSVFMVLDKIKPFVKILSPSEGDVIYANYVDVDWCISIDGDKDNCVKQDTLNFESLHKGVNTIKRIYRDKAGNEMVAEVSVMMKKAKDVNIDLEKPMILVAIDSVDKYYSSNPPEEDQSYAVSILNPTSQKEKEVVKGFDGSTKKGSGDEPYPGLDGHLGPTIKIDTRLPIATSVGGLATLDDIVINGDMVVLDEVDAADAKKVTVKEYVKEYCSDEFQKEWSKSKDFSKMTLYSSNAHVTLWFYTTGGQFIDKFKFDYDIDDPDYVDKAGLVKFFFEMKPDMNGELRDTRGRLYGTGPFIVKTQVDIRSKLRCMVPPINENSAKIGDVLKSSDELLTRFGYRRPVLHGNERPLQNTSKKSSKKSSKK